MKFILPVLCFALFHSFALAAETLEFLSPTRVNSSLYSNLQKVNLDARKNTISFESINGLEKLTFKRSSGRYENRKTIAILGQSLESLKIMSKKEGTVLHDGVRVVRSECCVIGKNEARICTGEKFAGFSTDSTAIDYARTGVFIAGLVNQNNELMAYLSKGLYDQLNYLPSEEVVSVQSAESCFKGTCIGDVRSLVRSNPFFLDTNFTVNVVGIMDRGFVVKYTHTDRFNPFSLIFARYPLPTDGEFAVQEIGAKDFVFKKTKSQPIACDDLSPNQKKNILDELKKAIPSECEVPDLVTCKVLNKDEFTAEGSTCKFTAYAVKVIKF